LEPREKTRRWISTLISMSVILIPILFFLTLSSPSAGTQSNSIGTNYTTDAQVIFNSFAGLFVILLFILIPIFYILYKRDKRVDLR